MNYCLPGEQRLYDRGPASHDRTATREAKGYERARQALLDAIKWADCKDLPADNAIGKADPVNALLDETEAVDLFLAVGHALQGDKDAAIRKLVEIANKAAAKFAFAHCDAFEDEA